MKIILLCSMFFLNSLFAMTSIKLSEKDKIQKSTAIITAKCVDAKSEFNKDKKMINTVYELQLLDTPIKGVLPKEWKGFSIPGGTVGKKTMSVEGVAKFQKGKSYLIFLDSAFLPLGASQGVLEIVEAIKNDSGKYVDVNEYKEYISKSLSKQASK